jgi:hypothetical protein
LKSQDQPPPLGVGERDQLFENIMLCGFSGAFTWFPLVRNLKPRIHLLATTWQASFDLKTLALRSAKKPSDVICSYLIDGEREEVAHRQVRPP